MIKRIVKWYLNGLIKDIDFQLLSLSMDLAHNKGLPDMEVLEMMAEVAEYEKERFYIKYVLNNILG